MIGHRGACGYRPEHTLASYELAVRMGADFIEPDLVSTADGVLVARHDPELGATTDVAGRPEFAARRTTKSIDGQCLTGWLIEDFTIAELRALRATERMPDLRPQSASFDGRFEVPTFAEVLRLRERLSTEWGREIGVYPEIKHPAHFAGVGLPLEPALVAALREAGLDRADAPVFVQSFEAASLRRLGTQLGVPLVQLIAETCWQADLGAPGTPRSFGDTTTAGLSEVASYAHAVGVAKNLVIPRAADDTLGVPSGLVDAAHSVGLKVHAYTFGNENAFLPADLRSPHGPAAAGRAWAEYAAYLWLGVDGVFSDHPDVAVAVRDGMFGEVGGAFTA